MSVHHHDTHLFRVSTSTGRYGDGLLYWEKLGPTCAPGPPSCPKPHNSLVGENQDSNITFKSPQAPSQELLPMWNL